MKHMLALVGILLSLPSSALAATPSLYEAAQDMVRKEMNVDANMEPQADGTVARFASELIPEGDPSWKKEEMDAVLRVAFEELCSAKDGRAALDLGQCAELIKNTQNTMRK